MYFTFNIIHQRAMALQYDTPLSLSCETLISIEAGLRLWPALETQLLTVQLSSLLMTLRGLHTSRWATDSSDRPSALHNKVQVKAQGISPAAPCNRDLVNQGVAVRCVTLNLNQ